MNVISCSHPTQNRIECEFCTGDNPCFDCPYLEIDEIDNDYGSI